MSGGDGSHQRKMDGSSRLQAPHRVAPLPLPPAQQGEVVANVVSGRRPKRARVAVPLSQGGVALMARNVTSPNWGQIEDALLRVLMRFVGVVHARELDLANVSVSPALVSVTGDDWSHVTRCVV